MDWGSTSPDFFHYIIKIPSGLCTFAKYFHWMITVYFSWLGELISLTFSSSRVWIVEFLLSLTAQRIKRGEWREIFVALNPCQSIISYILSWSFWKHRPWSWDIIHGWHLSPFDLTGCHHYSRISWYDGQSSGHLGIELELLIGMILDLWVRILWHLLDIWSEKSEIDILRFSM